MKITEVDITIDAMREELALFMDNVTIYSDSDIESMFQKHCEINSKEINIQDLKDYAGKAYIHTPDGYQPMGRFIEKGILPSYKITLSNGKTLEGSGGHLIQSNTGDWIAIKDSLGTLVNCIEGIHKVETIEDLGMQEVYDIEVLHENHRYWSNGISSHNTGKTFFCLNFAREAQKIGYNIIYCETEGAVDRSTVTKIGCDPNRLRYQPIKTVNEFKRFTVQVIDMVKTARENGQKPKIMLFLDSLGMLTTEKEINDAMEGKDAMDMGLKAKQMRAMFRQITLDLAANKIPLIVTNHTTIAGIGSYTGPTKESAGGDGPIFSLSTLLLLSKKFEVDDKNKSKKTGIIVNIRPKKSRSTIPTTVAVHVGFGSGMNQFVGLEEYVTWESCGIQKGKIYTEKEYAKEGASNGIAFDWNDADQSTGEVLKTEKLVFVPKETGRWCVKHLGKSLSSGSKLFNKEVFTDEVLRGLDEKVIKKAFMLPEHAESDLSVFDDEEDGEE